LIAGDHVDGLLADIEVILLVACGGREVKVPIYKGLCAGIEKSIYVTLVPTTLLDWLKLAVEIIEPLSNVTLAWFKRVIPRRIIESQRDLVMCKAI